jgi:protein gp37
MMRSRGVELWGVNGERHVTSDSYWKQPLAWNRAAERDGVRRRVFCASLADVFEARDDLGEPRIRLWRLIEQTSALDWLLLTKRPENVMDFVPELWKHGGWPPYVWLGASAENQENANKRVPILLKTPAPIKFLSCEPLLGPIDLAQAGDNACVEWFENGGISWVIVGGESGLHARPMHPWWALSLGNQCRFDGIPFFFKQWGEWLPAGQVTGDAALDYPSNWLSTKESRTVEDQIVYRVGKKVAGDFLYGNRYQEFPAQTG